MENFLNKFSFIHFFANRNETNCCSVMHLMQNECSKSMHSCMRSNLDLWSILIWSTLLRMLSVSVNEHVRGIYFTLSQEQHNIKLTYFNNATVCSETLNCVYLFCGESKLYCSNSRSCCNIFICLLLTVFTVRMDWSYTLCLLLKSQRLIKAFNLQGQCIKDFSILVSKSAK